ncbi:regulatory protein RecX [Aurantibacter sp.]|uniref:regulatory protein RecX n=1 Tax=Aurantibacter sp. TaxID=2807103 RepID=UPI003262DA24
MQFQKSKAFTVNEAIKKIEHYCAYQDRCHKEVVLKLKEMRMIPDVIDQIVTHLIQENYLNEERFSRSFARGKFRIKKWGKNRITSELKLRNISKFNIKAALTEIDDDEYLITFNELAEKRLAEIKEKHPQKRKKKLVDYLLYRGWESNLIYEKANELIKN